MKVLSCFLSVVLLLLQSCGNNKNTYQGYVVADNTYISSSFEGKLKKLIVKRGDKVEKGELLFVLDPKPQEFMLDEYKALLNQGISQLDDLKKPQREPALNIIRAKINQVEAQINLAQLRENRNQTLYNKKVLAKDTLDFSHEHLNELLAKRNQLKSQLKLAKLGGRPDAINAKKSVIQSIRNKVQNLTWAISEKVAYSPNAGVVYDTYFVEDELVSKARPVVSLLFPENIYLEFYVPYIEAKELSIGQTIEYYFMGENKNIKSAKVTYVSPEAEYLPPVVYSNNNMDKIVFKVKAKPIVSDKLIPGLPLTILIEPKHA